jgi:type IV secretory pathway VirB10-like protein
MNPNRLAVAALGFTCIAAAAGGGYLATRSNAAVEPPVAPVATPAPTVEATPAVQETEGLVADAKPTIAPAAPAPTNANRTPAAPSRRAAAPPRSAPQPPARRAENTAPQNSQVPALERSWPSSASAGSAPETTAAPSAGSDQTSQSAPEDRSASNAPAPEPPTEPEKTFDELVVSANSVVGLQLDGTVSSDRASVEDRIDARVVRDVRVGNDVAIPAGSRALGSVMVVERGGKFKDSARLGIRFHTLVLADGTRLPITSETIYRSGEAPGNASAAKIGGGAVAGAILGAILGGAKGAAVGATAGAGGGTAAVMAGDAKPASFPSGTEVTARILSPVTVTVEK